VTLLTLPHGGAVGLLTPIVGEIEDEYDARRELYRRVAPGVLLVSARAPVVECRRCASSCRD
jgi:hypothetical protein